MNGIAFPEKWNESARSISFRDRTPLHRTMVAVCPEIETGDPEVSSLYADIIKSVKFHEPVGVRWYWGSGETCRCIVWIHDEKRGYSHGVGSAGGGGYDKESAALSSALRDLGITLGDYECNSRGIDASRKALFEIGKTLGFEYIHIAEGHR